MVVENVAMCVVVENSLSTRSVYISVASEHCCPTTVGTGAAVSVYIGPSRAVASTDRDMIDLVDRVCVRIVNATDTFAQELVPEVVALPDESTLHLVVSRWLIRYLVFVARPEDVLAVDGYSCLVDVIPIRTPLYIPFVGTRAVDDIPVDGIVWAAI